MNAELLAAYEAQKAAGASPEILSHLAKALGLEPDKKASAEDSAGAQMTLKEFEAHVRTEILSAQMEHAETGKGRLAHLAAQTQAVTKSVIDLMNSDAFDSSKTFAVAPFVPDSTAVDLGTDRVLKALAANDVTDELTQRGVLKALGLDETKAAAPSDLDWGKWPEDIAEAEGGKSIDWSVCP